MFWIIPWRKTNSACLILIISGRKNCFLIKKMGDISRKASTEAPAMGWYSFFVFDCMESSTNKKIVPSQEEGKAITAESVITFSDDRKAKIFFETVKERLQQVDRWHEIAGGLSAHFQLMDENGKEVSRPPQAGDYFRIDIPGPGSVTGEGYDWVRVEETINEVLPNSERYGFRVRPARNPANDEEDIAHFFSAASTSTFIVYREGEKITAAVFDRNIQPNQNADTLIDKIRDLMAGSAGMLIFSKLQWKNLTEGLLQTGDKK
jgi:hypothetical protein